MNGGATALCIHSLTHSLRRHTLPPASLLPLLLPLLSILASPLLSFPEDPVTEARHTEGPRSERYQGPSWCRVGVES